MPTPNSEPSGITAGPDGALWFTEFDGNKIGRVQASVRAHPDLGTTFLSGSSEN